MCGIAGYVGLHRPELIEGMTQLIAHRGPDGHGTRTFEASGDLPPAALGHRRLSIIDPTPRGAQPMSYAHERYWITFNGEIYNYREIRHALEQQGYEFKSECDTEVVLAAYAAHGEGMLDRLNGMFALAIWDAEAHELFLARDRLGVKPLYYAEHDGALFFASEAKALLLAIPRPSMRHELLPDYLTFLWVPDPDTLFSGIYKLPPGHCARYAGGALEIREYWDLEFDVQEGPSEDAWASSVRETVQDAIKRQMVSDVPLGAFLSGGLDSGAVVATMKDTGVAPTTYTVGYSEADLAHDIVPDDLRYARKLGNELGLDYRERILTPDVADLLPRLIWHMDEPVADPAAISTYLICSEARESLKVILSGMGADEIFAGYPRHLAMRLTRSAEHLPRRLRAWLREVARSNLTMGPPGRMRGPRRNAMELLDGIDQDGIERYLTYTSYYRGQDYLEVLHPELRAEASVAHRDPFRRHRQHAEVAADQDWLNQLLYLDVKTFLPCLNLTYTDKMSMAASTEVRVPLLDDDVVDLTAQIPPGLKLRRTRRKYVLKKAMEGVLPDEVIWRPKAGFGAPVRAWLAGDLGPMVNDVLLSNDAKSIFDPPAVRRLIADNEAGRADNALRIWALLTLELWAHEFLEQDPRDHAATAIAS